MLVRELEKRLLDKLPASQAEPWDRTGMLVGDPNDAVKGVAVALDPTLTALAFAKEQGANVLLTHHPLFLDPLEDVKPPSSGGSIAGARAWQAIVTGISIISFHTTLDASPLAAQVLAKPLELSLTKEILEQAESPETGYGRIAHGDMALGDLAKRCEHAFGRANRMWGNPTDPCKRVCLWTGSASSVPAQCIKADVDTLICGELKYHEALDACESGLKMIELGHDVSEQVFCAVLVELLKEAGVAPMSIHLMDLPPTWR